MIPIIILFLLFIPCSKAYAYLDPGAGGMLVQIIMAGIAGVLTILKLYWNRVLKKIKKPDKKNGINQ